MYHHFYLGLGHTIALRYGHREDLGVPDVGMEPRVSWCALQLITKRRLSPLTPPAPIVIVLIKNVFKLLK